MAEYISMKQIPGGTVSAVDDRILYDMMSSSGVIKGCEISYLGNNMIHINAGYGVIKGGLFEMEDHTEYVSYAESGTLNGQIYLHFDPAAVDKLTIVKETAASLHQLVQNDDANFENSVYELQLCTFKATTTALQSVTQTFPSASGAVDVLDSLTEIAANNTTGKCAGALAVKQLNSNMGGLVFSIVGGKPYVKVGADSPRPFSGSYNEVLYSNWINKSANSYSFNKAYSNALMIVCNNGPSATTPQYDTDNGITTKGLTMKKIGLVTGGVQSSYSYALCLGVYELTDISVGATVTTKAPSATNYINSLIILV